MKKVQKIQKYKIQNFEKNEKMAWRYGGPFRINSLEGFCKTGLRADDGHLRHGITVALISDCH